MSQTATTPLAPMTPDAAISAFTYLRAGAEPRMPALLVDVAMRIVVPVTAMPGPDAGEPCEDTFALEALGRVFVTTLRTWAQAGPDAAEGIARAVHRLRPAVPHRRPRGRRRCPAPSGGRRRGPGSRCTPRPG
ncbi:hypothetical protein ACFVH9_37745 [Streptomyces hirsutus]|uniref:hypothetical protein n=1 Tax=Streptomyces hirsutus TaxID=35620 RepID=UPI003643D3CC